MTISDRKFYCSQKFWWLDVDIERMRTASCCRATANKINLEENHLFNTKELIDERRQMLADEPVQSCKANCWDPESQNLISRRLWMNSNEVTHVDLFNEPKILNIIVGKQCNLACVYCCKQYSSAWTHDIITNGPYNINSKDDRYTVNLLDKSLLKISQKQIQESSFHKILLSKLDILAASTKLEKIIISGGEPFLYNALFDLVNRFSCPIEILTGLGVDNNRLKKELSKLNSNVNIIVSGETTGKHYEFARNGNSWEKFLINVDTVKNHNLDLKFGLTVSNLTVFDMHNFINKFSDFEFYHSICHDPSFLSIHVMDDESKKIVLNSLNGFPTDLKTIIEKSLQITPTDVDIENFKHYIKEFCNRRSLSLDIFPKSFQNWIINVV